MKPAETSAETPAPAAKGSGAREGVPGPIDPPWFRADLFAGATITSSGRTPKDEKGLFATQMLFALASGTTQEACLGALRAAVAEAVPALETQTGADGRVTLRGRNDDYQVTLICGEAKGTMSAYVSYRWERPPTP